MRLSGTRVTAIAQGRGFGNQLWDLAGVPPSLDLRFAENKSLVDATTGQNLVTFTRASSGTYVDSQGVIRTAVTNLFTFSEDLDNAAWATFNISVTQNAAVAPNGSLTAEKLVENTSNSTHDLRRVGVSFTSGLNYVFSIYAKQDERSLLLVSLPSAAFGVVAQARFNLAAGTSTIVTAGTGTSASIANVGGGWFRCVFVAQATATGSGTCFWNLQVSTASTAYTGDGTSGIYLWGAQLEQSSTVGEYIPTTSTINSAPRFDHNPTTGESLGLLVEEQRTNSVRNNTMVGAVAGTPGTLPTNWSSSAGNGIATNVIGIGTENGISYIDIQFVGTATATSQVAVRFDGTANISASASTVYTGTVYMRRVSGSMANLNSILHYLVARNSGGSNIGESNVNITNSLSASTLSTNRQAITYTTPALTTTIQHDVRIDFNNNAIIDITLRIGLPQLEQGAFATSVIPSSGTAVTRSADVASITGTNFSSWYRQDEGTVFSEYRRLVNASGRILTFNDTTANEQIRITASPSTNIRPDWQVIDGGFVQANVLGAAEIAVNSTGKSAGAYKVNDFQQATNSFLGTADTAGTLPTISVLNIGANESGSGSIINGTIRRLVYWGQRLPNNVLQAITQ